MRIEDPSCMNSSLTCTCRYPCGGLISSGTDDMFWGSNPRRRYNNRSCLMLTMTAAAVAMKIYRFESRWAWTSWGCGWTDSSWKLSEWGLFWDLLQPLKPCLCLKMSWWVGFLPLKETERWISGTLREMPTSTRTINPSHLNRFTSRSFGSKF